MSELQSSSATCCGAAPKRVFACSGAADVGKIADLAARKLTAEGAGKMFCLAGIGGRVSGILASTQAAQAILAINGCPLDCAKNTLENASFTKFVHIRWSDLGMDKGKTAVTDEVVGAVVVEGKRRLAAV